jgi:predicted MFS family arabinose efflux permease
MPNLAGEERLEWANGTLGVAFNIGRLVGPVAGGALYVVAGRSVVFAVDAATYLVAAASIWSLLIPFRAAEAEADAGEGEEEPVETNSGGVFRGFAIVFADPAFRALVLIWAAGYFAVDIVLVGELPLARALGAGALAFGVLEAAWGGGSILGSLFGRKLREEQDVLGISIGVVGIVVGWGLIALSPWFIPIVLLSGMVAVASGVEDVAAFSMIQRSAADDVRGRVFSTFQTSGLIANAIAFAIAGVIVDAFGPRSVFVLGAVMSALCIPLLRPLARRRTVGTEVVPPTA